MPTIQSPGHYVSNRAHFAAWAVLDAAYLGGLLVAIRLIVRHSLTTVCLGILFIGFENFGWFLLFGGYSGGVALVFAMGFGVSVALLTTRVGVLAAYGFCVSLAGQPIFKDMLAEPQPA